MTLIQSSVLTLISPVLLHALCVREVVYNFIIFIGSCIHHQSQDIKQFQ